MQSTPIKTDSDSIDTKAIAAPGSSEAQLMDAQSAAHIPPVILMQCLDEPIQQFNQETPPREVSENYTFRILMTLRHIMHYVDSYSRQLGTEYQITGPQLVCLHAIVKNGPLTLSELGKQVSLSMSTTNGIVDRLEQKKLVLRERKHHDRRKVIISATEEGMILKARAPMPLQGRLIKTISEMPELEQVSIALSLEKILSMMTDDD